MSAEIIKIISTKQSYGQVPYTSRLWLSAGETMALGNDTFIVPVFNQINGIYELAFVISKNGKYKEVKPQPGHWVKDLLFDHWIRFLPMAVAFDANFHPSRVLVEFASRRSIKEMTQYEQNQKNI